jgi:adenylate cyclase
VLSRIDRLPPDRQLVLKVAAVIGRTFAYMPLHSTLAAYTATTGELLRAQLADLARLNMTVLDALEPDLTYLFKHIITRDAAYQTLLFAQRKQIHRLVAEWYERTYVEDGAPGPPAGAGAAQPPLALFATLLAYHYRHAENPARERVYAQLAGEQAAARYANPEAIGYLGRALELTSNDDHAARYALLLAREKVYDLQGVREQQRADLDALAALAEALADDRRRAEVALRRSAFANMVGDIPAALQAAERCVALAQAAGQRDLEAEGNQWWGWVLWMQGINGARLYFERAFALARDAGLSDVEARSLAALGNAAWLEGDIEAATERYAQALPLYQAAGDRRGESTTIMNLGVVEQARGGYASARDYYGRALWLKRNLGERRGESKVLLGLGTLYTELGLYDIAADNYRQALQISREIGGRAGECEILALRAEHLNLVGAHAEAISEAEQAAGIAQEIGSRDDYARALLPLADAQTALGNLDAADDAYRQALAIWQDLDLANMMPQPRAGLARIALVRGDMPQALEYAAQITGQRPEQMPEDADELLPVALTCYQVLQAAGDARAAALLRAAYIALQTRAARIDDPELRRSFLDRVVSHRSIVEAYQALTSDA